MKKDLFIFVRIICIPIILVGLIFLAFNWIIGLVLIAISVVLWNIAGFYLKRINADKKTLSSTSKTARKTLGYLEANEWKKREYETNKYMQFQNKLKPISDKYYSQLKKIEAGWSVIYNLKDYEGIRSNNFEKQCRENIYLYKQMAEIEKSYGETPPVNVPAFKRLAMLYEKQGSYKKAADVCKEALNCGANGDDMKARLCRLLKKCSD